MKKIIYLCTLIVVLCGSLLLCGINVALAQAQIQPVISIEPPKDILTPPSNDQSDINSVNCVCKDKGCYAGAKLSLRATCATGSTNHPVNCTKYKMNCSKK